MLVEWKQFIAAKYVNLLVYAFIRKYFSVMNLGACTGPNNEEHQKIREEKLVCELRSM